MDIPLELCFHNMDPSDALKEAVEAHVARLEQFHDHIVGCRVVIEMPHKSHRTGQNVPDVHIVVRVPGKNLVVSREMLHAANGRSTTDAYSILDNAFAAAQGQLKDHCRIRHGHVKSKSPDELGRKAS
jgi:ribosome-associated translation inhibitor RaiA